jgi:hypothetical protein
MSRLWHLIAASLFLPLIVEAVGPEGTVALMFDEDEAGWKGREDALSRLSSQVYVKVIGLGGEGRQPDGLSAEELTHRIGGLYAVYNAV